MGDGIFFQTKTISGIFSWDMLVVGVYTSLLIQYYSYAKNNLTFSGFYNLSKRSWDKTRRNYAILKL